MAVGEIRRQEVEPLVVCPLDEPLESLLPPDELAAAALDFRPDAEGVGGGCLGIEIPEEGAVPPL